MKTIEERFFAKVDKSGECWEWTASKMRKGYGQFMADGRNRRAHRLAYELANGPIPDGLVIDHTCFNRGCVNPAHLRAITHTENNQHRQETSRVSKSGHRGITWHAQSDSWQVRATKDGKSYAGGLFKELPDAIAAMKELRAQLAGVAA